MRTKEPRPTLSADGRRWPEADPVLQIWPLSGTHHSDGKFRWDWIRGLSNTGFLVDGRGGKKAITGWANTSFIDPREHQTCEGYARTHIVKLIRRFSQTNPRKTIRLMMHKSFFPVLTGLKQQKWNKTTCTLSDKINQFTRKKIITACYWIAPKQENSIIHLLSFAPLIERHMR